MRKLFNEFFYISRTEKIREKAMLTRVAVTVTVIVFCLIAMSVSAYAYFSHNVVSGVSMLKPANFVVDVLLDSAGSQIVPQTTNNKNFVAELNANTIYTVTITPAENNTASTGFIIVSSDGCEKVYNTQQLGKDNNATNGRTDTIKFNLTVSRKALVTFQTQWGTSSMYTPVDENELYITQNETINMVIIGGSTSSADDQPTETKPEATETTEPTKTTPSAPEVTEPIETQAPTPVVTEPTETQAPTPVVTEPTETQAPTPVVTEPAETQAPTPVVTESAETQAPTPEATEPAETQAPTPVVTEPTETQAPEPEQSTISETNE